MEEKHCFPATPQWPPYNDTLLCCQQQNSWLSRFILGSRCVSADQDVGEWQRPNQHNCKCVKAPCIYLYLFIQSSCFFGYIIMPCMYGSSQMVQIVLHGCTDKSHQMNYSQERNVKQVLQTIHRFHNRFTITEKDPTRAFSWLKAATTAFTFKTIKTLC